MNKICTSIEQSKKLIELGIDIRAADMYWWYSGKRYYVESMDDDDFNKESDIPAWSLTALLNILRAVSENSVELYYTVGGKWAMECYALNQKCVADEPVDACVAMIEKLDNEELL